MKPAPAPAREFRAAGFRLRLLIAMMVLGSAITAVVLTLAERRLEREADGELRQRFQAELAARSAADDVRNAALIERCRSLVAMARIHAALEDDALDLLYPSAVADLSDLLAPPGTADRSATPLHGQFYRFLDSGGNVIPPSQPDEAGPLPAPLEASLALRGAPNRQELGYVALPGGVDEIIATPIISSETGEVEAALVLGLRPWQAPRFQADLLSVIRLDGHLYGALSAAARAEVGAQLGTAADEPSAEGRRVSVDGQSYLLFVSRLNAGSAYPAADQIDLFPLASFEAREARLRREILLLGGSILLCALIASRFATRRLSAPVEKLAAESERSARFSADASHQLKTPVTVLRAGLEELLAREHFTPEECAEISALVHQTYRLSSLIDDLLLLSRMDAGRLTLEPRPVHLSALIEGSLDDLGALPSADELSIEAAVPSDVWIAGESRYTAIILQNLLENARKYNRPKGRIRIAARVEGEMAVVTIGNTGRTMSAAAREHIFERFHRGTVGENVPGYGLGLNLARELARIHHGDLRLAASENDWTEFELRLPSAPAPVTRARAEALP